MFPSFPEAVYLSTLLRKNKWKKVLKNLQGLKKKKKQQTHLLLFCNGPGCEIIRPKNTAGMLRVAFSDKISLRL